MDPATPIETQDVQFKQTSTKDICNLKEIPECSSLIVSDDKRGLLYIGHDCSLSIVRSEDSSSSPWKLVHYLDQPISRLSLSCDSNYIGVTFRRSTGRVYQVESLLKNQLELVGDIQLSASSSNAIALDFQWNPAVAGMFVTVSSDGWIGMFQVQQNDTGKYNLTTLGMEKPSGVEATCVCWSPKGKQVVVGTKTGNIVQLKPDLKVARTIGGPGGPFIEVLSILWISNYQFCAAYVDRNEKKINVTIVDAPKGEQNGRFTNYDDITYGTAPSEGPYSPTFYFLHIPEWNIIIASSNHSFEIGMLASSNNSTWVLWMQPSEMRALLPLQKTEQPLPLGIALAKSSTTRLPWADNTFLDNPVPLLHIFGTSGQVFSYYMVNLIPEAPAICTAPSQPVTETRSSLGPSEISFHLNAAITSTPRQPPKPVETKPAEKCVNPVNLFAEPPKLPAATISVPTIAAKAPQVTKLPTPSIVSNLSANKVEIKEKVAVKESTESSKESPSEKFFLDDSICLKAYQEEKQHFDKEIKMKLEPIKWEIGSKEEWQRLINQTAEVQEFERDLREATTSLSNEIGYLKALLLQSFAWVEEAKSRNSTKRTNERYDRTKIQELKRMVELTQSQLIQAVKALDLVWMESEDQERTKMRVPSLEFVYQSLKRQTEIIAKEKNTLEKQMKRCQILFNTNVMNNLNSSISKLNISAVENGEIDGRAIQMRCKLIAKNTRNFTKEKQNILRDVLSRTKPRIIKAISPTAVQDKLEATLSSLTAQNNVPIEKSVQTPTAKPQIFSKERKPVVKELETPSFLFQPAPVTPSVTQKSPAPPKSPLDSLNNIIAKIGNLSPPEMQGATKPLTSSSDGGVFPKVSNVSFGMTDTSSVTTTTKETLKPTFSFKAKENPSQVVTSTAAAPVLFETNFFDKPLDRIPVSTGSGLNFSFKDSTPSGGAQQNLFGFPNSSASSTKPAVSVVATTVSSAAALNFSFAAKPLESIASLPPSSNSSLDFKISQPEKITSTVPANSAAPTLTSAAVTSSLNFGAVPTPNLAVVSTPSTTVSLPTGTSIVKVPVTSTSTTSSTSTSISTATSAPTFPSSGSIFGGQQTTSVFGGSNTSTTPSIFGGSSSGFAGITSQNSVFEGASTTTGFFGGSTPAPFSQPVTTSASDFTTSFGNLMAPSSNINFGKPPSAGIFGKSTSVSPISAPANIFGSSASKTDPPAQNIFGAKPTQPTFGVPATTASSVFGTAAQQMPPFGQVGGFGQASPPSFPTTPTKPQTMFGAASTFGVSPTFGGAPAFGPATSSFGGGSTFGGFRAPVPGPAQQQMQGFMSSPNNKVFGSAGSSTFESLAGQNNGLSFSSLAQKSVTPEKPAFNPGSSFSSWR